MIESDRVLRPVITSQWQWHRIGHVVGEMALPSCLSDKRRRWVKRLATMQRYRRW